MNTLAGKRILVTRAAEQFEAVARLIEQRGGVPLPFPCLAVQCLPDNIRDALRDLPAGTSIIMSSTNGVHCAAQALGEDFIPLFSRHQVIVVGPHTADALCGHGIQAAWVADETSQDGLIQGFMEHGLPASICFLRAEEGRDVLQDALRQQDVEVRLVHAYRTVCPEDNPIAVLCALRQGEVDAVLLGSSRTAQHYLRRIGDTQLADRPAVAVISPQVAAAAETEGLSVQAVAKQASFAAMLDALAEYFTVSRSAVEEHRP
ncbi:MAG: hypothetical protein AUK36_11220 [Zetaproteobacteria bacterium CG2_30_59_37]|nr:MAG: hypothetical protein AUK36_11220 [Zetaproteobacteria bacterium CG2_30_59_37]